MSGGVETTEGSHWLWEIKLDGYRAVAANLIEMSDCFSQQQILHHQYPDIVKALGELPAEYGRR